MPAPLPAKVRLLQERSPGKDSAGYAVPRPRRRSSVSHPKHPTGSTTKVATSGSA